MRRLAIMMPMTPIGLGALTPRARAGCETTTAKSLNALARSARSPAPRQQSAGTLALTSMTTTAPFSLIDSVEALPLIRTRRP